MCRVGSDTWKLTQLLSTKEILLSLGSIPPNSEDSYAPKLPRIEGNMTFIPRRFCESVHTLHGELVIGPNTEKTLMQKYTLAVGEDGWIGTEYKWNDNPGDLKLLRDVYDKFESFGESYPDETSLKLRRAVIMIGPPGIGKSCFLQQFCADQCKAKKWCLFFNLRELDVHSIEIDSTRSIVQSLGLLLGLSVAAKRALFARLSIPLDGMEEGDKGSCGSSSMGMMNYNL